MEKLQHQLLIIQTHIIDIKNMKLINFFLILSLLFLFNCTIKKLSIDNYNYTPKLQFIDFKCEDSICTDKKHIIKYKKDSLNIIYTLDTISLKIANNTQILNEIFNDKYVLISECISDKFVSSPWQLKRKKIWVYNSQNKKLFYADLNNIMIEDVYFILKTNAKTHNPKTSPYGLNEINENLNEIILLDFTRKLTKIPIIEVN